MRWTALALKDVSINIQTGPFGSQLHQSDYSGSGIPVVMPKDILNDKIVERDIARVEEIHVNRLSRHIIKKGDIIYSRRGDVGRCAFVTEHEAGWLCGTGCLRVTIDPQVADPKFVFYQLQQPATVGWVEKHAIGATMLNLNTTILGNIPLSLPTIETQKKIADILSAYDNLIKNNQKQIMLLEEAAQRLYKEWFINLHFPGYEDTAIVDGVPDGWTKNTLLTITEFKRGKTITKEQVINGFVPVVAGGLSPAYYHNKANTTAPVITVSASGANAGYVKLYLEDVFASDCSFADIKNTPYLYFVYCFLKNNDSKMRSMQKGAAQPHVYAKDINAMELLIPPCIILKNFCDIITPYFELLVKKEKQIKQATAARNRLLPKLMSGELEVTIDKKEPVKVDKFENIRKHWQNVPYNADLPLAARKTGDISEETLEKLKDIAEEE